jgi:hypothetical protein
MRFVHLALAASVLLFDLFVFCSFPLVGLCLLPSLFGAALWFGSVWRASF